MQTPFDTLFEQVQPDATEILAAPFLISGSISKKALHLLLSFHLNSTNFDTYKIIPDYIKHHLQKSHGILKKMLAFLCEVYYNRDILNPRKQGFVWH